MDLHSEVLAVVAAAVILDMVTGVAKAAKKGQIESTKMRDGLWHKAGYIAIIALAYIVEYGSTVVDLGFSVPLIVPVCVFIVLIEVASIVENAGELNPELKSSAVLQLFKSAKGEPAEKED